MILATTQPNREQRDEIRELIGKPISWIKRFKMGGNGSRRIDVGQHSAIFFKHLHNSVHLTKCNIEIREKGVILYLGKGPRYCMWVIPFHFLQIYRSGGYTVHATGHFVRLKTDWRDHKFFKKLINLKASPENTSLTELLW